MLAPKPLLPVALALSLSMIVAACSAEKSAGAPEPAKAAASAGAGAAEPEAKVAVKEVPVAAANLGEAAPDFSLADLDGDTHTLAQHRGKVVVLEWFNPECPFVNYAHQEGELKAMAKGASADGVVWLAINSGAPGKQGHGVEANRAGVAEFAMEHPVLLDESGAVGRRYGAGKTPHLFVIDAEGALVYRGAIDNAPMGEVRDAGAAKINYVAAALEDLKAGRPVAIAEAAAYGCSVKYGA